MPKSPLVSIAAFAATFASLAPLVAAPVAPKPAAPKTAVAVLSNAPRYNIVALRLPPGHLGQMTGATSCEARAMNDRGQIVGVAYGKEYNGGHVVLWDRPDALPRDLGGLPGYKFIEKCAINNAGQIVGTAMGNQYVRRRAFVIENGVLRDMGTPPGDVSEAHDINNRGEAIVTSYGFGTFTNSAGATLPTTIHHVLLWTREKGLQEISGPFKAKFGNASLDDAQINDNGDIIGEGYGVQLKEPRPERERRPGDSSISPYAFLWRGGDRADGLNIPKGYNEGAYAINNNGAVLVSGVIDDGLLVNAATGWPYINPTRTLFLWRNGKAKIIGNEPKAGVANRGYHPYALNDAGDVVGIFASEGKPVGVALLCRDNARYPLESLVAPTSGWSDLTTADINNQKQILGRGVLNKQRRAFVMTPK